MPRISPFQMTEAKSWSGLTTANHLGSIYNTQPQEASKLATKIHQENFGLDLDSYLGQFPVKYFDTDDDFVWDLVGSGKKNVPLSFASIDGTTAVAVGDQPGIGGSAFYMIFPEAWFTDVHVIVGHKNEKYPVQIIEDPVPFGTEYRYRVELLSGDPLLFVPVEELAAGKRWSKDWSLVEKTLNKKGGGIGFTSPFKMRNAFSMIRMEHTTPGNMINRPMGTKFKDENNKVHTVWTQYEDYMFDMRFREEKNRLLMFATSNRKDDGTYSNFGKSGYVKAQGAGIRQQMEAANQNYYNDFSIDYLADILMDLSEGKISQDKREFVISTGERGAKQFAEALEDKAQLFQPLRNESRMYSTKSGISQMSYGYGGQFVEYMGFNGVKVNLRIDSLYDDRERNKIYHPDGGVAESYRMDILDVGTTDGEPNIQKCYVKGQEDILGYQAGLRHPFAANGEKTMMSHATDGYTVHRASVCGAIVRDPSRTAQLVPSVLA